MLFSGFVVLFIMEADMASLQYPNESPQYRTARDALLNEELSLREQIERVLDFMNWNKSKAAEMLGIERSTLYARIRNYEIKPPSER